MHHIPRRVAISLLLRRGRSLFSAFVRRGGGTYAKELAEGGRCAHRTHHAGLGTVAGKRGEIPFCVPRPQRSGARLWIARAVSAGGPGLRPQRLRLQV